MWNAGLDESQAGIKMPGEISIMTDMKTTTKWTGGTQPSRKKKKKETRERETQVRW